LPASRIVLEALTAALLVGASGCKSRVQLSRGDAAVVVTAAPTATPAGARALTELEPNGALGRPTALVFAGTDVLEVTGNLGDDDEEDRFTVDLPAPEAPPPALHVADGAAPPPPAPAPPPRQLALELAPAEKLGTSLTVSTPEGRALAVAAAGPGEASGVPNLAVLPGARLLLSLRRTGHPVPGGPASAYRLVLRLGTLGPGDEREPNESAAEATPMAPAHTGPEVAGLFGTAKDVDWFVVPVGAVGEATVVSVEVEPPSGSVASVTVHDGGGRRVAGAKGRIGSRVVLRQLSPAALGAGSPAGPPVFFVAVRADNGPDREHRYLLRVRAEDAPASEREPNDDAATATPLVEDSISGYAPAGDVDVYRLTGAHRGQPITLTLVCPPRADLVIEASPPGAEHWSRADAGRRGQPETLIVTPAGDGDVLIRVTPKRAGETEDEPYRIKVQSASGAPAP
jgi:hypothetical protein